MSLTATANTPVFDLGNDVHCTGLWNDTTSGEEVPIDPFEVFFSFRRPGSSTLTVYQYGVNAQLLRDGVGSYRVVLDANLPGLWSFRFYSTGVGKASEDLQFLVNESLVA